MLNAANSGAGGTKLKRNPRFSLFESETENELLWNSGEHSTSYHEKQKDTIPRFNIREILSQGGVRMNSLSQKREFLNTHRTPRMLECYIHHRKA